MTRPTIPRIVPSLFLGAGVWPVFLRPVRRGELDDGEGPKHGLRHDDEPPGPSSRETRRT